MKSLLTLLFFLTTVISCNTSDRFAIESKSPTLKNTPKSKGGWESSGGDGILCVDGRGPNLTVLDSWDFLDSMKKFVGPSYSAQDYFKTEIFSINNNLKNLKADKIIDKVLFKLWKLSPLLSENLELIRDNYKFEQWIGVNNVDEVMDSQPKRPIPINCKLVQIANRKTIRVNNQLPLLKIYYNQNYYEQLNEVEKAILQMHEYFYLLAKESNHKNSDEIRKLVAFLFSKEFSKIGNHQYTIKAEATSFRHIAHYYLGDYMRFFLDDFIQNSTNELYRALINFMQIARSEFELCFEKKPPNSLLNNSEKIKKRKDCLRATHNSEELFAKLTPAESFTYILRFAYDYSSLTDNWFSESLMTPNSINLKKHNLNYKETLTKACKVIEENVYKKNLTLYKKAKQYCQQKGVEITFAKDFRHYYICTAPNAMMEAYLDQPKKKIHFSLDDNIKRSFSGRTELLKNKTEYIWGHPFYEGENLQTVVFEINLESQAEYVYFSQLATSRNSGWYIKHKKNEDSAEVLNSLVQKIKHSVLFQMECEVKVTPRDNTY